MILKFILPLTLLFVGVICLPSGGKALLGAKECTWGPSYWCKNLTAAHGCKAVRHCISTVWEHLDVKEDNDDVCTICKRMVGEARAQLESNQTLEELKEVFDGSCKLMYVKPAVEICTKLADELVPELVDTIGSQMNPDIVCSVAGLCNNEEIDAALDDFNKKGDDSFPKKEVESLKKQNCDTCGKFFNQTIAKIEKSSSLELMEYLLNLCGKLNSYSDSCASHVINNFDAIEEFIRSTKNHGEICYTTGSCVSVRKSAGGDTECDFCQQIILHVKDILIADTTQLEFKKVLKGICAQTKKFSDECNSIVDEYSDMIYKMIANDLDAKAVCSFFQICPVPTRSNTYLNGKFDSILPASSLPQRPAKDATVNTGESSVNVRVVGKATDERLSIIYGDPISTINLPSELYDVKAPSLEKDLAVNEKQSCVFCQYLLHYVQKVITQPYGEDAIKKVLDDVCDVLPKSVEVQCREFVSLYGDAFIAIVAQEIDPSQVCPSLKVCPAQELANKYEPEVLQGGPTCPLCLFVIQELYTELSDNKTKASVREALSKVCAKLPSILVKQCDNFVEQYTEHLVDMIVANFTPQQVCMYLNICKDVEYVPSQKLPYDVLTNEITDFGEEKKQKLVKVEVRVVGKANGERLSIIYGDPISTINLPSELYDGKAPSLEKDLAVNEKQSCVFCQYLLHYVQKVITQPYGEDAIKKVLDDVCDVLPKSVEVQCREFVSLYGDAFVAIVAQEIDPSQVCPSLKVCPAQEVANKNEPEVLQGGPTCSLCIIVIEELDAELSNNKTEASVREALSKVCAKLPNILVKQCDNFVEQYTEHLVDMIVSDFTPREVCMSLHICTYVEYVPSQKLPYDVLTNEITDFGDEKKQKLVKVENKKAEDVSA